MSDSILSDVIACILILLLLFVGPIYQNFETTDKLVDSIANSTITNFQKEVRKSGYIDFELYNDFLNELSKTGRVYKVTIIHTNRLVYPSKLIPNDYEIHEIKYSNDIIIKTIQDGASKYFMKYGDDFKVIIKEKEVAPSRLLTGIIGGKSGSLLTFSSGGMIENEVFN